MNTELQENFQKTLNVSCETMERFNHFVNLLKKWQSSINLVSRETIPHIWNRHILDSAQLYSYIQGQCPVKPANIIDMGSGAGFPGLVLGLLYSDAQYIISSNHSSTSKPSVILIESDQRKATFLREVIRICELKDYVKIINKRIENIKNEDFTEYLEPTSTIITARALAPLKDLIAYGSHINKQLNPLSPETHANKGIAEKMQIPLAFLKGANIEKELTEVNYVWHINYNMFNNLYSPESRLIIIDEYHKT